MTPCEFPEANIVFGAPPDFHETAVNKIPAFLGVSVEGPYDGSEFVIVAWKPDAEDLKRINAGGSVYLCSMGGLLPHSLTTDIPIKGLM